MKKLLLIGAGGHCKSVIDVIEKQGDFEIFGLIDKKEKVGEKILDYEIVGTDEDLEILRKDIKYAFIAIGQISSYETRFNIYKKLKNLDFEIPTIVSPLAYVSKHVFIGEGTIIMHHAVVNSGVRIGINCILNTKSLIEHDCEIGDFCHISTGVIINGGVKVGFGTFIGSGSISKEYITIPEKSFIKAGSIIK